MTAIERWTRPRQRPLVLGHRGAGQSVEENTLASFEQARSEGADGIELDVQSSLDRVPFVTHDLDLRRVTDGATTASLHQLTSHELALVHLRGGHAIPRLEEVLDWAWTHQMLVNIELKTHHWRIDTVSEDVAKLLRSWPQVQPQLIVSSFHPLLLRRFRHALPTMPIALLFTVQHLNCVGAMAKQLGAEAVHPDARYLQLPNPPDFRPRLVNVWTINEPVQAQLAADRGVNGIITDCPRRVLESLEH